MIHHAIKNLTKEKPPGDGLSGLIADLRESSRLALPSVASGPPYYYGPPSHLICSHERPLSHSMRRWMSGPTPQVVHQPAQSNDGWSRSARVSKKYAAGLEMRCPGGALSQTEALKSQSPDI